MITLDKLLATKVFYFGALSADNEASRRTAIAMLGPAIDHHSSRSDSQSQLRLAFYLLVRAELARIDGHTSLADRQAAQLACYSSNSRLYDHLMHVVERATVKTKGEKRSGLLSAYGSSSWNDSSKQYSRIWWRDFALAALGESPDSLSEKQRHFIEHASLRDLFEKHGVAGASG